MNASRNGLASTYIGGPTVVLTVDGVSFITDPTFDPAGGEYASGTIGASRDGLDPEPSPQSATAQEDPGAQGWVSDGWDVARLALHRRWVRTRSPKPHPRFRMVAGSVETWKRTQR